MIFPSYHHCIEWVVVIHNVFVMIDNVCIIAFSFLVIEDDFLNCCYSERMCLSHCHNVRSDY